MRMGLMGGVMARNDMQVKIDAEVFRKAKQVAFLRDITLAEYLSERLRPLVEADLVEEQGRQGFVPASGHAVGSPPPVPPLPRAPGRPKKGGGE
jgi:hypothetical protein